MKVVILAGGLGTRIAEESHLKPKPMIEIGDMPILWHIMKLYSASGFNDFIVCCGYKQWMIKEFFMDYYLYRSDVTFDFTQRDMQPTLEVHSSTSESWKVTVVDTGLNTMTGGRVKRIRKYVGDEPFMLTYGDGVADIDLAELLKFHTRHGRTATLTAVHVSQRFGVLGMSDNSKISSFREKKNEDSSWINGGFMVFNPEVFDFIKDDDTVLEKEPMEALASHGELMAYRHAGFWQCMDTQRDKLQLEELWASGSAPWKIW
jgi:glucose-1-phosphate cytidylyltransferase